VRRHDARWLPDRDTRATGEARPPQRALPDRRTTDAISAASDLEHLASPLHEKRPMDRRGTAALPTVLILAIALLIGAAAACTFDAVHDDHRAASDLCLLPLAISMAVILPILQEAGSAPAGRLRRMVAVAVAVPAPPPKRAIP